jgi:tetratricopeptide (TPR) repeat protein
LIALVEQGCYRCLADVYEAAVARNAPELAFEAAALLSLRAKELGMPYESWLERARAFATVHAAAPLYLDIVDAIPPDPLSGPRDPLLDLERRRRAKAALADWRETLDSGPGSGLFRAYLDVSLVCAFGTLTQNPDSFGGPLDAVAGTPLYRYRVALCGDVPALEALRRTDPALADADYALGRSAIEDPINPDYEEGLARLESAASAFPESPAILATLGNVHRSWEEWAPALAAYDKALAVAPDHPEAQIGRAISLSRLRRHQDAIAATTALVDRGQWRLGEAYYWRAWNQLALDDLPAARSDADRAKTLMANAAVHVLSGTIEWRLRRLETAEQDFQQALTIDLGECEAALDLGVVRDERGRQREALEAFRQAGRCYELSIRLRREAIAKIEAGPGNASTKARAIAVHQRALADIDDRYQEALRAIRVLDP